MGRITIFSTQECPHCLRTKAALNKRDIPFVEISLSLYPTKRNDMLSLTDRMTVPQVFFNEQHVGGADETLNLLQEWDSDNDSFSSPLARYQAQVESLPDPTDTRLAVPTEAPVMETLPPPMRDEQYSLVLPDGSRTSVLEITTTLRDILPIKDRSYNFHIYKNSFTGIEGVSALQNYYGLQSRDEAVAFGKKLQAAHHLLHHVCEEHDFTDQGYYYRLQCFHTPDVLNSFRVWTERVDPDSMALLKRLKNLLGTVESAVTDQTSGLVDYVAATQHKDYKVFEEAVCELQGVDMGKMDETTRKAFGINLYNLMIKYAFIKSGIGTSNLSRATFFGSVKFNIGGDLMSFNDLENGVLRANSKPPYGFTTPFASSDQRLRLALAKVDCRIHFALNCGAKSCPPVKYFTVESLQEELRVVSQSFCEQDDTVAVDEEKMEVRLSMIMNWFRSDFAESKEKLPEAVLPFLRGTKRDALRKMLELGKPIVVKFQSYDWSTNASNFQEFDSNKLKANQFSPSALLKLESCKSAEKCM